MGHQALDNPPPQIATGTALGSECSIRITANPLTEEGGMGGALPEETWPEGGALQWDYEAMGMNYNQLLDYFDNLKESNAYVFVCFFIHVFFSLSVISAI